MFHWLQRVRHFKPVLVAQRWLNLFQGYPIPQGLSTQSRPEGRGLNPTFLVSADGMPNVSPKELWRMHDRATVIIADIASGGSVRNLQTNPACCVSFVDVFRQKGFKLVGTAHVIGRKDADFEDTSAPLRAIAGNRFFVRNVIAMTVEHVAPIVAPSYALHNASEEEMMANAFQTYSVKPVGTSKRGRSRFFGVP